MYAHNSNDVVNGGCNYEMKTIDVYSYVQNGTQLCVNRGKGVVHMTSTTQTKHKIGVHVESCYCK